MPIQPTTKTTAPQLQPSSLAVGATSARIHQALAWGGQGAPEYHRTRFQDQPSPRFASARGARTAIAVPKAEETEANQQGLKSDPFQP
mmetsp:Transcript_73042/g.159734  ORF Transcript_73042/g.159734 Transcript_73042/m.159734 type:complete len:88 (-) Transcript_73042:42-305(-)